MLYNVDIYSQFHRLYLESLNGYRVYCVSILKCLCMDKHSNHYVMKSVIDFSVPFTAGYFRASGDRDLNQSFCVSGKW